MKRNFTKSSEVDKQNVKSIVGIFNSFKNSKRLQYLAGVEIDAQNIADFCRVCNIVHLAVFDPRRIAVERAIYRHKPDVIWMCGHGVTDSWGESSYLMGNDKREDILGVDAGNYAKGYTNEAKMQIFILDFCQSGSFVDVRYRLNIETAKWEYNPVSESELVIDDIDLVLVISAAPYNKNTMESVKFGGELTTFMLELLNEHGFLNLKVLLDRIQKYKKNFVVTCNRKLLLTEVVWRLDTKYIEAIQYK
jgi:hypothetical protein